MKSAKQIITKPRMDKLTASPALPPAPVARIKKLTAPRPPIVSVPPAATVVLRTRVRMENTRVALRAMALVSPTHKLAVPASLRMALHHVLPVRLLYRMVVLFLVSVPLFRPVQMESLTVI